MPEKTSMQRLLTTFRFSSVFGLFHQINTVKPRPVATPVENLINQKIVKEVRTLAFSLFKCTVLLNNANPLPTSPTLSSSFLLVQRASSRSNSTMATRTAFTPSEPSTPTSRFREPSPTLPSITRRDSGRSLARATVSTDKPSRGVVTRPYVLSHHPSSIMRPNLTADDTCENRSRIRVPPSRW